VRNIHLNRIMGLVGFWVALSYGTSAMAYESIFPRTPVGRIEIKKLPERRALAATADGDTFSDRGAAFKKLFAYIREHDVSMTLPVAGSALTNEMTFFVGRDQDGRPLKPTAAVDVRQHPATTVASIGLRGSYTRAHFETGLKLLRAWMERHTEWRACGEPYAVYWSSPFVPFFLRRSEIHLPVTRVSDPETPFYAFAVETIDGQTTNLAPYRGQAALIVNVASKCGFTRQYAGLQALYERYRDRGFTILAFPSNDFMGQEPGSNAEIRQFCSLTYGVSFPLFAKIHVKGGEKHPLYAWLTDPAIHPGLGGEISWNFNKFLLGRDGTLVARFGTRTAPDDPSLATAIEQALSR